METFQNISFTNSTPETTIQDSSSPSFGRILVVSLLAVTFIIFVIIGNGLVMFLYIWDKNVRVQPSNIYLVALAFVDFLIGLTGINFGLLHIYNRGWAFGPMACQFWLIFCYGLTCVSSTHLVLIALDRYRILFQGLAYLQKRNNWRVLQHVGCSWLLGAWVTLPILIDWKTVAIDPFAKKLCFIKKTVSWVVVVDTILFIFPGYLMIKLYLKIFLELRRRLRDKAQGRLTSSPQPSTQSSSTYLPSKPTVLAVAVSVPNKTLEIPKFKVDSGSEDGGAEDVEEFMRNRKAKLCLEQERKAMITLGVLIGAFILCWTPYVILGIAQSTNLSLNLPKLVYSMAGLLGWMNSAINPVVYAVRNRDFQIAFKKLFFCCRK